MSGDSILWSLAGGRRAGDPPTAPEEASPRPAFPAEPLCDLWHPGPRRGGEVETFFRGSWHRVGYARSGPVRSPSGSPEPPECSQR